MAVSWAAACVGAGGGMEPSGAPAPRSGHTFTTLAGGDVHILFGGSGQGRTNGSKAASAFNDVHVCSVAPDSGVVTWAPLVVQGPAPPPRARHTAVAIDACRLLMFGGLDQKIRYNDCWVLDVTARSWSVAQVAGTPPPPRAHHTGGCFCTAATRSQLRMPILPEHGVL